MNRIIFFIALAACVFFASCRSSRRSGNISQPSHETNVTLIPIARNSSNHIPAKKINTKNVKADQLVYFAETLIGTPYKYASADKEKGFDCSGFITYVFNHFNISVPRSSVDFTNAGTPIPFLDAKKGDLILFTGSDKTGWIVGHMGIITENNNGKVKFIHSASGNNRGVMISDISPYFFERFVKVIRVFTDR